ncbi:MAG: S8 family peptidase [Verrucomicrobiaceae bacterium]
MLKTTDGAEFTRVLLHVPYGQLTALVEKFRRYGEERTEQGNVPNPWVANVARIARAALVSMWTDRAPLPEDQAEHWWQLWVRRYPQGNVSVFRELARRQEIFLRPEELKLPDHIVFVARSTRSQLESSIDLLNTLAEIRAAKPWHYELSDLSIEEQHEWIDLALQRILPPEGHSPAVCILDTGINSGHRLLQPVLGGADNHTIFGDGDPSDSHGGTGHGTLMAGLAAYADLRGIMMNNGPWQQLHRLEGVKVIDPNLPHEPQNYGAVTIQGVARPEGIAPSRLRVYVMAITADGEILGEPSAWAAAVDNCAFGAEEEGEPKRLIILSAGNVDAFDPSYRHPEINQRSKIEDPAQAWNAITVGAMTNRARVLETDAESTLLTPVAPAGGLSPFSRTSCQWDGHWPIKPEIVMEGGNVARTTQGDVERRDSLDLLSTSATIGHRPLAPFRATSAAAALAAHLAATIQATYPALWPETIRGLLVHSARWTDQMLGGLDPHRPFTRQSRDRFTQMLRSFGFGCPDAARACHSSQQEVTLLRQDELSPYTGSAGSASVNDCHVHQLKLPADLLRQHGATTCTMRVTLSYFTAPNPSASNRIPGSRYRYGGCLLRFKVKHKDQPEADFMNRVSADVADDEEGDEDADIAFNGSSDPGWALGDKLRGKAGSLAQDVWRGSAADLAAMDCIAVFPVKGWWASRSMPRESPWHRCHKRNIRYSLIVSIETEADIPLYNEISNLIAVPVEAA